jgi:hypothetical protein
MFATSATTKAAPVKSITVLAGSTSQPRGNVPTTPATTTARQRRPFLTTLLRALSAFSV